MDDITIPKREVLAVRLRDLARRHRPDALDDLEIGHLVDVVLNHSLLLADVLRDDRLRRVLQGNGSGASMLLAGLMSPGQEPCREKVGQLRRIPDDIRLVGDKCLYDAGLFGKTDYHGYDLVELGCRSYVLASEVLNLLSEDRSLREYFRQNRLSNLPIEEEIVFLRQCGARFKLHADLLRDLHLFDGAFPVSTATPNDRPLMTTEETNVGFRPVPEVRNHDLTTPKHGSKEPSDSRTPEATGFDAVPPSRRFTDPGHYAGGMMEELPEFPTEDLTPLPAIADMDRLPRKDLLSLYERMLLFSSLDIEDLRAELKRVVIDQEEAVETLCDELSLYATGTQSLNRPASYFFVGPTGVGKNHLMESMVRSLQKRWDFEIPVLQLEGPQYTYPSDINELKGAARGFIRSDEEGILTEFYSRSSQSPFSVILVDEVEKSHPQLRKFFLSLMDRGTTMDNRGQMLNFINTMIVYTSNIGYSRLQTQTAPIGFLDEGEQHNIRAQEVDRDLKKILSPEFVNRLTVIPFGPLSRSSIESIFELEFDRIAARYMAMHGIELTVTPRAKSELLEKGYNAEFGARPMARLLNVVCNIEVSKKLKRDEKRSHRGDRSLREYIREVKEGKRAYDAVTVQRRVMGTARIQVPYRGIAVDFDGGRFLYLPQGEGIGSH